MTAADAAGFRIEALDPARFAPLFDLPDAELARHRAVRTVATSRPGFPCRVSLEDAAVGDALLLVNHTHLPASSPFHASHAIYVRRGAAQSRPAPGSVPAVLLTRTLSLRGFDAASMLLDAAVAPGAGLADALSAMFGNAAVAQIHIHFAGPGCYAARAVRAEVS